MYFEHEVAKAIYGAVKANSGLFPPEVEQAAVLYDLAPIGDAHRAWWNFMAELSAHAEEISKLTQNV